MRERPRDETYFVHAIAAIWARLWGGSFLLGLYGIPAVTAAWRHIWGGKPWPWLRTAETLGIPYPLASLSTVACLLALACLGLILGFVTRFCAALVLLVLSLALYYLPASGDAKELALAYAAAPTLSLFLGGGPWSIDGMLRR